jgi:hypothetical protein
MGEMTLGADELKTILVPLALIVAAAIGAMLHMRHQWRALRHKLAQPVEDRTGRDRPCRVEDRLGPGRLGGPAREVLERLRRDLEADGDAEGVAAVTAVAGAGERLDSLLREVATRAIAGGELRSALVRLDEALAYLLVFPGRREDPRTLRRYEVLSEGWRAHAAALREAAGGAAAPPLVALLYFLGLDAREGSLLVACEGDRGSRFPEELAEPAVGPVDGGFGATLAHDFVLG